MNDASDAERRLQELLSTLRHWQGELELAERNGFEFVAESARREIRIRDEMVRRDCSSHGLPIPPEVTKLSH